MKHADALLSLVVTTSVELPSHHPNIRVVSDERVVTVTLDRPQSKNACTGSMWVALGAIFRDIGFSGSRAAILTGANGNFCTGADLGGDGASNASSTSNASSASSEPRRAPRPPTMTDSMRVLGDAVLAIHQCPVPVVAKVDGLCVGAGLGLALVADLTLCSEEARFSAIFAKRGLSLDFGTSWLLRQRIGVHRAKELAFTAKMISGREAFDLGLVNAAVPANELDAATQTIVDTIAAGPPIAIAAMKRQLDFASTSSLAQSLEFETLAQSVNVHTDDMREAFVAYAEKRPANFSGS